jgi:hypothetical protein
MQTLKGVTLSTVMMATMWAASASAAERQVRPFIGVTFGGDTTFVDLDKAIGHAKVSLGFNAAFLGEMLGVDVDFGHQPGFFQAGDSHLVLSSSVTTLTGNIIVAMPRRLSEYTLRPYILGGAGLMRANIYDYFGALQVAENLPTIDVGVGALGFLTNHVGICWEVRRFRSFTRDNQATGVTVAGSEQLSFWRATTALSIRY